MTKTIFIGNGINRTENDTFSWNILLKNLNTTFHTNLGTTVLDSSSFTFIYESILMNMLIDKENAFTNNEAKVKEKIKKELEVLNISDLYQKIIELKDVTNILTTNYDLCIQKSLELQEATLLNEAQQETIYSVRRKDTYQLNDKKMQIWNIHGSIKNDKSIMLGYDHYCGYISKIDDYIKGNYTFHHQKEIKVTAMEDKIIKNQYDAYSWIDLFFHSDIHFIGFGLDYSELDIWWLLIRRARLMKKLPPQSIKNKIYFYCEKTNDEAFTIKKQFLKHFNIEVVELTLKNNDYIKHYQNIIKKIEKN